MASKKYFSRHTDRSSQHSLSQDMQKAIQQEPENASEIIDQFNKASKQLKELQDTENHALAFGGLVTQGREHMREATFPIKVRKRTFEDWMRLQIVTMLVSAAPLVGGTALQVATDVQMDKMPTPKEQRDAIHKYIDYAVYASVLTIWFLGALLYIPMKRIIEEEMDIESWNSDPTEDFSVLFHNLRQYICDRGIITANDISPKLSIEAIWDVVANKELEKAVIELHKKQKKHSSDPNALYKLTADVGAVVIGSMSDKDIRKLYSLLQRSKTLDAALEMVEKHISSDPVLTNLAVEMFQGTVSTDLLVKQKDFIAVQRVINRG